MTINVELLDQVMDHIDAHPEEWDQNSYGKTQKCGTTFCFAGHTGILAGYKPVWDRILKGRSMQVLTGFILPDGTFRDPFESAQHALNLSYYQARDIFYFFTGSRKDLRRRVEDVKSGIFDGTRNMAEVELV